MSETIKIRDVFREAVRLVKSWPKGVAISALAMLGPTSAADFWLVNDDALRVTSVFGLVALYIQLIITTALVAKAGVATYRYNPRSPTNGRYAGAFLMGLMKDLALIAAALLLVVPGLILMIRWSLSFPALVAEQQTATGSLRRSWEMTRTRWRTAALTVLWPIVLVGFGIVAMMFLYPDFGRPSLIAVALVNIFLMLAQVGFWLLALAFYALIVRTERQSLVDDAR